MNLIPEASILFDRFRILARTKGGARERFQLLVTDLVKLEFGDADEVAGPGGQDWGIDTFVGRFDGDVQVWQSKFFTDGIKESQKDQIRSSFNQVWKRADESGMTISRWTLALPIVMDPVERRWFDQWRRRIEERTKVVVVLWSGSDIRFRLTQDNAKPFLQNYFGSLDAEVSGARLIDETARLVSRMLPRSWRDGPLDEWLRGVHLSEERELTEPMSADQDGQLAAVLQDDRVHALVGARAFGAMVISNRSNDWKKARKDLEDDFLAVVASLAPSLGDRTIPLSVWRKIEERLDRYFDQGSPLSSMMTDQERAGLTAGFEKIRYRDGSDYNLPTWLRDLMDLARDLGRIERAQSCARDLREDALRQFRELKLIHALEDSRRPLEDLYVQRTLLGDDGDLVDSDSFFGGSHRVRLVVTGAPGTGKSTLTQHLLYSLSGKKEEAIVPVRVRVRELDPAATLLTQEISERLVEEFQNPNYTHEAVHDLLALGRGLVVFDGIDEMLSLPDRRRIVEKIEAFALRYPLASVVVTSRNVGYESAALSPRVFARYRLRPFTDAEVEAYARNWFDSEDDERGLANAFLKDVESVPDLRENPLILSLLCTLYKARGHIPKNRRHVYTQCADLLFNRWDSMRQIDQPTDHVDHGQDLMQEIAVFFFNSSSAQRGVEEVQLCQIIAQYLMESAGVLPAPARSRARAFLEFCAGRAWLLGGAGVSNSGERLFVFTHRTFMEFFAAEGIARSTSDPQRLADKICDSYLTDSSSVFPELVALAAEASRRHAAREIVRRLKERGEVKLARGRLSGGLLPLRLRIAAVLPLQPAVLDEIILDSLTYIADCGSLVNAMPVLESLSSLPRDANARVRAHLEDPASVQSTLDPAELANRRLSFLRAWIAGRRADPEVLAEWNDTIERLWVEVDAFLDDDRLLRVHALGVRRQVRAVMAEDLTWTYKGMRDEWIPNAAGITAIRIASGVLLDEVDQVVAEKFFEVQPRATLVRGVQDFVDRFLESTFANTVDIGALSVPLRSLRLAALLASIEVATHRIDLDALALAAGEDLVGALHARERAQKKKGRTAADVALTEGWRPLGGWVVEWLRGRYDLTYLGFVEDHDLDDW